MDRLRLRGLYRGICYTCNDALEALELEDQVVLELKLGALKFQLESFPDIGEEVSKEFIKLLGEVKSSEDLIELLQNLTDVCELMINILLEVENA